MSEKLSEGQWRVRLNPLQFHVLRESGTERAFTGAYWNTSEPGSYLCAGCATPLFTSDTKYHSGCGWPSFTEAHQSELWSSGPTGPRHGPHRGDLRHVRRSPRARVRRRTTAERASVLHQQRIPAVRARSRGSVEGSGRRHEVIRRAVHRAQLNRGRWTWLLALRRADRDEERPAGAREAEVVGHPLRRCGPDPSSVWMRTRAAWACIGGATSSAPPSSSFSTHSIGTRGRGTGSGRRRARPCRTCGPRRATARSAGWLPTVTGSRTARRSPRTRARAPLPRAPSSCGSPRSCRSA